MSRNKIIYFFSFKVLIKNLSFKKKYHILFYTVYAKLKQQFFFIVEIRPEIKTGNVILANCRWTFPRGKCSQVYHLHIKYIQVQSSPCRFQNNSKSLRLHRI